MLFYKYSLTDKAISSDAPAARLFELTTALETALAPDPEPELNP